MTRRIVITGRGVLSPLGCGWPAFARALREGQAARAAPFSGSSAPDAPLCHEISDPDVLTTAPVQEGEPLGRLASAATRDALAEAGVCAEREGHLDDVGFVMTTALGPSTAIEAYLERLQERGPRAARPALFVDTLLSMPASRTGIALGLRGSTAVLGASSALEVAFDWLRSGREHSVVAGGADYLSAKCLRYHRALAERSGAARALLAQSAAFLVLEASDHAQGRGARSLGELLGSGSASEPQAAALPWSVEPSGAAFEVAVRQALADAGVERDAVSAAVLAAGDDVSAAAEVAAVGRVLGRSPVWLRPKHLLGEPLAAGEGLGVLAALAVGAADETVLVNSLQMGGAVTSLIVRPGP